MRPKQITVAEVEYIAFKLAEKFMTWDEPIPNFGTRFPNILESCLSMPFQRFSFPSKKSSLVKKDLYRGLIGKASILFYLLIKNHPFQNGNKRIAVMCLLDFLHKNGKWLNINKVDLYNFARGVAKSRPPTKEKTLHDIQRLLKKHIIDFV